MDAINLLLSLQWTYFMVYIYLLQRSLPLYWTLRKADISLQQLHWAYSAADASLVEINLLLLLSWT